MEPEQTEFETFHWLGQLRYKCNRLWESGAHCEYDHHDLDQIRKHAASPHGRAVINSPLTSTAPVPQNVSEKPAPEFENIKFASESE